MRMTMLELYTEFGLESGTHDFIGHALALELDEGYLQRPALDTCARIKLYMESMLRFGKSPYVYPMYGLGELPQSFARLCAIYGGTFMLDQPVDEILYGTDGRVTGIRSGDSRATCRAIIADPSYVVGDGKVKSSQKVLRVICLLDHPIPNTGTADSCQVIIPQRQLNRKYDVYIASLSHMHQVCAQGFHLAMVSTILEKTYTDADSRGPLKEVEFAMSLLGPILETFSWVSDVYEPVSSGTEDGLFISKSYDATSHFETICEDVRNVYARLTGKPLVIPRRDPVVDDG
jgi:Rab GDP dissociation inhibitor